ncbi:hypothetical protein SKAU_G00364900 [Synaphobranchus kaupii]|uniref:Uncharacterized protein n=1 Tax=Synaphobranchus kaupii TaxID=118154 RepID=A0A9Q1EEW5_SYNKA|nr:hypothetical protein SKAU_G00364900 [Synaphobranchus kaupii]
MRVRYGTYAREHAQVVGVTVAIERVIAVPARPWKPAVVNLQPKLCGETPEFTRSNTQAHGTGEHPNQSPARRVSPAQPQRILALSTRGLFRLAG